ncbi:MAG TPA: SusC/RagA family TonB-linked outer membrane protein [Gemmatimonadaceae bacterium]|nr:SusC/RagA family TonB-linked outer membrane protein [Gemmatimonadaceae bacterium]
MRRILAILAVCLACAPGLLRAQTREISGKVTEIGTGTPVTEATIGIVGVQIGTRTNDRGEFRLKVPAGEVTVIARAIGYKRQSTRVTADQTAVTFTLEKDVLELEGVTVTGQATTLDKKNANTPVATVSAADLNVAPAKSLEAQLAGKVVGAQVYENSGVPGGGMQVQIRGATSILGQGDPLYVVDGVMVSNASIPGGLASITRSGGSTNSTQDQTVNRLADLNPADIESIEVLKSAAATAIYGSRATNGVVVITTKKGRAGGSKYNITQRVGESQATRLLGSRHFSSYADGCGAGRSADSLALCVVGSVKPWLGSSPVADSIARANCTPTCAWYDWQKDIYGQSAPAFETDLSTSGGINATRYYGSLADRQTHGVQINSGARLTSGHLSLDQTIGDRITVSGTANISRDFVQDGVGNNENSGTSPIYSFGYWPAIYDITQRDPATGRYLTMYMGGGGNAAANPMESLREITNNEETWRQMGNVRLGYSVLATGTNAVQLTYIGGVDRYQFEANQYSPNFLQFESADGFLGTSQIQSFDSRFLNQSINAVWTFTPTWRWLNSAQTSVGGTRESQYTRNYFVRERGLVPTRETATGGTDISTGDAVTQFLDQSRYVNEQIIALGERLSIAVGARADRSSANGDRGKFYLFPKYSASYRFVEPFERFTSALDEVKFRASYGQSGNRPNYAVRDVTISSGGVIGGTGSLVAAGTLGNPDIQPEVMNEFEYGADAALFHGRVALEVTRYQRVIKDLLVNFPLPPSSGLTQKTINGGQMSTLGVESGVTFAIINRPNVEWTFRTTYQTNAQSIDKLAVPAFAAPGGSFGSSYGRNRIAAGVRPTYIWGNLRYSCINKTDANGNLVVGTGSDNKPCRQLAPNEVVAGSTVRDSIIADANPRGQASFLNSFRWKRFSATALLDWRIAGYTSDMTKNLWDEGGNAHDFDKASPIAGMVLGDYRYSSFANGNISTYIDPGSFVKLREVNISYDMPERYASIARAQSVRLSFEARNLFMWTNYWSFDPEFNNFGNQNFNRFIDLAPYPSNRQFYLSIDLGY